MLLLWTSLFSLLFSFTTSIVLDLILCPDVFSQKKAFSVILIYIFLSAYIKMPLRDSFLSTLTIFLFFLILFFIVRRYYGISSKKAFMGIALLMILSLIGDIVALYANFNIFGFDRVYEWTEPGILPPVLVSNMIQILIAYVFNRIRYHSLESKAAEVHRNESIRASDTGKEVLMIAGLFVMELLTLVWFFLTTGIDYDIYAAAFYPSLGIMLMMALIISYFIYDGIKDEEQKRLQKRIEALDKRNSDIFKLYKRIELDYIRLHKIRHDINNQITSAIALNSRGEREQADSLFKEIEEAIESICTSNEGDCP